MREEGKVLLIYPPQHEDYGLWNDLKKDRRVILRSSSLRPLKSKMLAILRLFNLSSKINSVISLPFKSFWYDFSDYKKLKNIEHVIILDLSLDNSPVLKIARYFKKRNIFVSLYLINAFESSVRAMEAVRIKIYTFNWDFIFTFDEEDAKNYNFNYLSFCYYSRFELSSNICPENDLYLVATLSPDRVDMFFNLYKKITNCGLKLDFNFCFYSTSPPIVPQGIKVSNHRLPYKYTLKEMMKSKTILEVVRGNQSGPTLRYFEAVCYNKKLLTNNSEIVKFPYYNNEYMKIFSSIDDIDIDWLKDDSPVDYHYKGDFSPCSMIDYLLK